MRRDAIGNRSHIVIFFSLTVCVLSMGVGMEVVNEGEGCLLVVQEREGRWVFLENATQLR